MSPWSAQPQPLYIDSIIAGDETSEETSEPYRSDATSIKASWPLWVDSMAASC